MPLIARRSIPSITSTTNRARCFSGSHSSTDGGRRNPVWRSIVRKLFIGATFVAMENHRTDSIPTDSYPVKSDRLLGPGGPCPRKPTDAWRSDRHLEFLGGAEGDLLACLDFDGLAGRRIAAHAGGALAHLQYTEAGDLHPLAPLQVLGDQADEVLDHLLALFLGKLMRVRERVGQMLGGDWLSSLR